MSTALTIRRNARLRAARDDDIVGMRVRVELFQTFGPQERASLYDQVLRFGLEVWLDAEEGEYVFRRPTYKPVNRRAHADRHKWILKS